MSTAQGEPTGSGSAAEGPSAAGGLLDVLGVAAVVLDADGRVALWSPQAEELFGYRAEEALGAPAARLLVHERHRELVSALFAKVMAGGGPWAGVFPVRHKDGSTRLAEFRNMRLQDRGGRFYALGIASDLATVRQLERELALSGQLVSQTPIAVAVFDTDLRFVMVNRALEGISGRPASRHLGRRVGEVLPCLDAVRAEAAIRRVLAGAGPVLGQSMTGRPPGDPDADHTWSVSVYRLEDQRGAVIGAAASALDITSQQEASTAAARSRRRLALIADASVRIGTTLDLDTTARELADVLVPEIADVVAVDILDSALRDPAAAADPTGDAMRFRALAVKTAYPTEAARAADPVGELTQYGSTRLVTRCVATALPVLVPDVGEDDLARIARDSEAADLLARAGVHSYLAVPLTARGEVLGAIDLKRARTAEPFDSDDMFLVGELATRAAVCIDNARWYQRQRHAALALQRHLLPPTPSSRPGLEIAYRYQPAAAIGEPGGDWFDVIPLAADRTALVVGDVMGHGINAAATMGQLRLATRALAKLDLTPAEVLAGLDDVTADLDDILATCVLALYDPRDLSLRIATAGHLPPVLTRPGHPPELLRLPPAAPLGVNGALFRTTEVQLGPGDELLLYTDGLVEVRDQDIDVRLAALTDLLGTYRRPIEAICDLLLTALPHAASGDDIALLMTRIRPDPS
ncbi:SpoIIE family protein phosphatase [Streptomyces sp. NRRL S-350]|uniref:SpoIIE family protein phosphatase n=1 Tax=Streptomyces sp. NRRL S-350 TaxID=1463902 RepID=UPI000562857D|nr:SpoIIE family protein phosphatase [Streptomyces sp. NRRL S-350]